MKSNNKLRTAEFESIQISIRIIKSVIYYTEKRSNEILQQEQMPK